MLMYLSYWCLQFAFSVNYTWYIWYVYECRYCENNFTVTILKWSKMAILKTQRSRLKKSNWINGKRRFFYHTATLTMDDSVTRRFWVPRGPSIWLWFHGRTRNLHCNHVQHVVILYQYSIFYSSNFNIDWKFE